jgi:hypothetical protein
MSRKHIINSCAPFFMGVHCVAQKSNLAISSLGDLT